MLPRELAYPIVAIGDLHGHREKLERLVDRLETRPEWPDAAVCFLGDFVDRGPDVRGTIDLALELLARPAGGSAVMGNHDLALVRAARLDDGPASPYWAGRYRKRYSYGATLASYLGSAEAARRIACLDEFDALREAMPAEHRAFLAGLPWVVEAPGHLFLHNGLSPHLEATAEEQLAALHAKRWERSLLRPMLGTKTDTRWEDDYPTWIGADRDHTDVPKPHPGKIQVTGHEPVGRPDANAVRIRIDTTGGDPGPLPRLTACLLRSAAAEPIFLSSRGAW